MKKIAIPFDFSQVSVNALNYALSLFKNDSISIIHVSEGMFSKDVSLVAEPILTHEKALNNEITRMVINELGLKSFPSNVRIVILDGEIVHAINKYVRSEYFDFVLLGTRDRYDLLDRWIGTISLGLAKILDLPVYLIPRYSNFTGFKKVLVASDFHLKEEKIIGSISKWNEEHHAYIKFMHIQQNEQDDFGEESDKIVNKLFEKEEPKYGFEISSLKSIDVSDSLLATAYNYHADLLIVLPEEQDFISALLFKSISKEMILKSNIPVLFLHPDHILAFS
jgi:nucleotide-binding universal stress UspA family protein